MRYWLIGILALFVCSCHGMRTYAPSESAYVIMTPGPDLFVDVGDLSYKISHHIPAEWASALIESALTKDHAFVVYQRLHNDEALAVGALISDITPLELVKRHVVSMRPSGAYRFGQFLTMADGSQSYVAFDSAECGLSGAILYRREPGVSGVALNVTLMRRSFGGNSTLENIALVTRVARSLQVSPVIK